MQKKWSKIQVHNNASSHWKSPSPVVSHIKNPPTYLFRAVFTVSACKTMFDQCRFLSCFRPDEFFTGEKALLWMTMEILAGNKGLKFKHLNDGFVSCIVCYMQLLASQEINWWTGEVWIIVMFYQLFGLSFWRHPFTAEHPMVSKWCKATFQQIWSYIETTHLSKLLFKLFPRHDYVTHLCCVVNSVMTHA